MFILALPAFANITSGSLTGRVQVTGAPARGVTVTAESTVLQAPRTTITDADGRYWLGELPPGTYDVTFSLPAHTTFTKRAIVELARVARADAVLEPNPDEDATTSTAIQISVADTLVPTSHFDDRALDRLPYGRIGSVQLAPGFGIAQILVDGIPTVLPSEDAIDELTILPAASPVEWEALGGNAIVVRTRPSQEELFFTVRDTITKGFAHYGEATAGGRIVPQRLWFFAGAWGGQHDFPFSDDSDGGLAKLDAQLGAAHHVNVSYMDARLDTASIRYTATAGPNFTSELIAARVEGYDFFTGRASYDLGAHLLTGGYTDSGVFFASDRWSSSHWNVYAGLRRDGDDDELLPRAALSYDLHGNGRQAITATWGDYDFDLRVTSLGFATAIGNSGTARADAIRREAGDGYWQNMLHLDARYRLFDRFEAGATYALSNQEAILGALNLEQEANVWFGAEIPIASHEFGATVVQHYFDLNDRNLVPTDIALRYAIPLPRVGLLLAADATNVFAEERVTPRAWRLWLRVRI
ncbi:MAG TPA: carboxypeptidase-like regulatory domain-containing protein [Thermoanaerobaculia bacterium]